MPRKRANRWTAQHIAQLAKVGPRDGQLVKAAWKRDTQRGADRLIDATRQQSKQGRGKRRGSSRA